MSLGGFISGECGRVVGDGFAGFAGLVGSFTGSRGVFSDCCVSGDWDGYYGIGLYLPLWPGYTGFGCILLL